MVSPKHGHARSRPPASWRCLALCGALIASPACGGDDGAGGPVAVGVETIAPSTARAGDALTVVCLLVDAAGETFVPPEGVTATRTFSPEDAVSTSSGEVIATRAGTLEVACAFAELELVDETPAVIEVTAGPPARTVATVEPPSIVAGDGVTVTCEVFDDYDNPIDDASPTPRADPEAAGNVLDGDGGTFERAGNYEIHCDLAGTESVPDALEVTPSLPASLVVSRVPDAAVYEVDQPIELASHVEDRFGNPIPDAVVTVESDPAGTMLGDARFSYPVDGRYTLTATVLPPTDGDVVLSESVDVVVDSRGPMLPCDPALGETIVDLAPGSTVTFSSTVDDVSGVTELRVDGSPVTVAADGTYSADVTTVYGINFVTLAATDGIGRENTQVCAFLVADTFVPDGSVADDTISLRLAQAAIDDGDRGDPIDSIADVLAVVLNSRGLRDQLHAALLASNPLKPSACDQTVLGVCVLRSQVRYLDLAIDGPSTVSLALVDGGVRWDVLVRNLRVRVRVDGHVSGIPYDTTGWVTFSSVRVQTTSNIGLAGGRPRATIRPGSTTTTVGAISTSFSGLDGAVINVVTSLFNGTVRAMIANLVTGYVTDNMNDVLDGVLGGLEPDVFAGPFDVPRLDGGAPITVDAGVSFSSATTSTSRTLWGLGTRASAPAAHARPTLGAPVRTGPRLLDVSGPSAGGAALHEAALEQLLHSLWSGGYFDAALDETTLSALPAGATLTVTTVLPPVAEVASGRVRLSLGGVHVDAVGLTAEPIRLTVGARVSVAISLAGDLLVFDDFAIDELHVGADGVDVSTEDMEIIDDALAPLLEHVIGSALTDALPSLPIPSLPLPASLTALGLPGGAELTVLSPSFATEPPHLVTRGSFGLR